METREVDGGGMIPIDLFEGEDEPRAAAGGAAGASHRRRRPARTGEGAGLDAGRVRDAAVRDAAPRSISTPRRTCSRADAAPKTLALEAGTRELPDAAGSELVADAAGARWKSGRRRDPRRGDSKGPGLAEDVLAGPPLVRLLVNMNEIRKNPVGAQMGPLMSAIPQWDEFMAGTKVDAVRDADWITITGPSLLHTERDVIMVHYSAPDPVIDHAIDLIRQRSHNGAGFDAGVPGVKATLGHADRAPRVFLRPQPHVVAVTPPDYAETAARMLVKRKLTAHILAGEAMRLTVQHPHGPFPTLFPEEMTEVRLWVVPRADGGADVHGEGRCPEASIAAAATANVEKLLHQFKGSMAGIGANMLTHNALDSLTIRADGSTMKVEARVTRSSSRRSSGSLPVSSASACSPAEAAGAGRQRRKRWRACAGARRVRTEERRRRCAKPMAPMRTPVLFSLAPRPHEAVSTTACSKTAEPDTTFTPSAAKPLPPPPTALESHDDVVGTGREAKTGDTVKVQYTGTLLNGDKFDSSYDHGGDPFSFTIGKGDGHQGLGPGRARHEDRRQAHADHPAGPRLRRGGQPAEDPRRRRAQVRDRARVHRLTSSRKRSRVSGRNGPRESAPSAETSAR